MQGTYPENCQDIAQDAASKGIEVIPNGDGTFNIFDMFIPFNKAENIPEDHLYDAIHKAIVTSDKEWRYK